MLSLNLYIHGAGCVAPAADAPTLPENKRLAREPDYTAWIPPMQLRRTSKVVRMGIGAARLCTEHAGIARPDAISVGTAMGCLQDTEVFLSKMVGQQERMLTPTAFIQSTHNTVGGQIALLMGCHGHNMTFVHRGHSFEHALINTKLYLQDHPGETVLAGGIDELTPSSHILMQRAGFYASSIDPDDHGVTAGEGAAFFAVNERAEGALLKVVALHLFTAAGTAEALAAVQQFVQDAPSGRIDRLVLGNNHAESSFYKGVQELAPGAAVDHFKQVCGEYATAGAYALASLAMSKGPDAQTERILVVNHYCDHYSCWLLER